MKTILHFICLLSISVLMSDIASAEMLLSDNFNDNSLDTSLWKITKSNRFPQSSFGEEANGQIELTNRAMLSTVDQFNPYDYAVTGGLALTGKVYFVDLHDIEVNTTNADLFKIVIRSNNEYNGWGEVTSGIGFSTDFIFNESEISLDISAQGSAFTIENVSSTGTLTIHSNTWYDFTVTDAGTNLSCTFTQSDDSTNTTTVTAQVTNDTSSTDYIYFYGREDNGALDHSEYLDDISISTGQVPEPSSIALLACGLIGLLAYAWRKRK